MFNTEAGWILEELLLAEIEDDVKRVQKRFNVLIDDLGVSFDDPDTTSTVEASERGSGESHEW